MLRAVEATIGTDGAVRLHEPVQLKHSCRAIVTIIEDSEASETAYLSQEVLSRDWERPEEDSAWSHLQ